jgi:hypothetical protein
LDNESIAEQENDIRNHKRRQAQVEAMKGQSADSTRASERDRLSEGEDILGSGLKIIGVNRNTIKEMNISSSNINGCLTTSNTCKTDFFKENNGNTNDYSDRDKYIIPTMPKSDNVPLFINQMNFNS